MRHMEGRGGKRRGGLVRDGDVEKRVVKEDGGREGWGIRSKRRHQGARTIPQGLGNEFGIGQRPRVTCVR